MSNEIRKIKIHLNFWLHRSENAYDFKCVWTCISPRWKTRWSQNLKTSKLKKCCCNNRNSESKNRNMKLPFVALGGRWLFRPVHFAIFGFRFLPNYDMTDYNKYNLGSCWCIHQELTIQWVLTWTLKNFNLLDERLLVGQTPTGYH